MTIGSSRSLLRWVPLSKQGVKKYLYRATQISSIVRDIVEIGGDGKLRHVTLSNVSDLCLLPRALKVHIKWRTCCKGFCH